MNRDVQEYIHLQLSNLTKAHIDDYMVDNESCRKVRVKLLTKLEKHLPKIKGLIITSTVTTVPYNNFYKKKGDLEIEIITEMELDKSKRTKEWLDDRIQAAALELNIYADEQIMLERKELSLLKRRINRYIKSRY